MAFGDSGSSNPGICQWEQMSRRPTFWKAATVSPTGQFFLLLFFLFQVVLVSRSDFRKEKKKNQTSFKQTQQINSVLIPDIVITH